MARVDWKWKVGSVLNGILPSLARHARRTDAQVQQSCGFYLCLFVRIRDRSEQDVEEPDKRLAFPVGHFSFVRKLSRRQLRGCLAH